MHKGIVGFNDSKLRREEELEALPREMVWMRPLAAQHVTGPINYSDKIMIILNYKNHKYDFYIRVTYLTRKGYIIITIY
jgi:hypothetical protein